MRGGAPETPPELIEQARAYVNRVEWTFAKTMISNPHHYRVRPFQPDPPDEGWEALAELIKRYGSNRRWHGRTYRAFSLDGFSYWLIWPVVNRKPSTEAGWED